MTAATATTLRAAVLLRRMSLSRSRVFPGVCTMAHEGVFLGAPRGGAHTSPPQKKAKEEDLYCWQQCPPLIKKKGRILVLCQRGLSEARNCTAFACSQGMGPLTGTFQAQL